MKRYLKKSAAISHVFFTFAFASLLSLCYFRYLRLSLVLSAVCAFLFGAAAAFFLSLLLRKKLKTSSLFLQNRKERESFSLYLSLSPPEKIAKLLYATVPRQLFPEHKNNANDTKTDDFPPEKTPLLRTAAISENLYRIQKSNTYFYFSSAPLSLSKAETLLKNKKDLFTSGEEPLAVLYSSAVAEEATALLTRFRVLIRTEEELFNIATENNVIPNDFSLFKNAPRPKRFILLPASKKTARGLLLSAAFLIFFSLFSPFPHYYRVFGILLLCLSLAAKILSLPRPLFPFRNKLRAENTPRKNVISQHTNKDQS